MAKARHTPTEPDEPFVWRIVGPHEATLNAIADGLALVRSMIPAGEDETAPPDILASEFSETADLARTVRLLAEILVGESVSADPDGARAAERSNAMDAIAAALEQAKLRINRRGRADALGDASELIREMGLEHHDVECTLGTAPDGTEVLLVDRLPRPVVYASLFGRLFQRTDGFMSRESVLTLERAASTWFFSCWSAGTQGDEVEFDEFPRSVREQEWSAVSRDTLALAEPVIASFAEDTEPEDVPARQRYLATAFARSTVGVFEIMGVDGALVTVRDTADAQTYRIYEHNEDADPFPGLLILGRLIPIEDDLWLRSPGALIINSESDAFRDDLVTLFGTLCETLPTPLALEAVISTTIYGVEVPLPMLPAPTIAEARAALAIAAERLQDIGLLTDIPESDAPADLVDQLDSPALGLAGLAVDQTMAEWLAALSAQAALDTPPSTQRPAKRKRAKQPQKKKRRR